MKYMSMHEYSVEGIGFNGFKTPEQQKQEEYQRLIVEATQLASAYSGTEVDYNSFMTKLFEIEECIMKSTELEGSTPLSREIEAAEKWQYGEEKITFSALIDKAQKSVDSSIKKDLEDAKEGKNRIIVMNRVRGIFLPTSGMLVQTENDGRREWEPTRFEKRLEEIVHILEEYKIYIDDLVISFGEVLPNQVREVSYACIEIPRIQKMLLVCDQVGEATFVVDGYLSRDALMSHSKDELLHKFPGKVEKVEKRSSETWKKRITELLFSDGAWSRGEEKILKLENIKVDVKKMNELRQQMQEDYTPEEWSKLKSDDKRILKDKYKIGTISFPKLFGIKGDFVASRGVFLQLGLKIFGEDNEMLQRALKEYEKEQELKERTSEWWRMYIREKFTPEQWIQIPKTYKRKFKDIHGIGLIALAKLFAIEEDTEKNYIAFLNLGLRIFGESDGVFQVALEKYSKEQEIKKQTPEVWRTYIEERFTREQWIKLSSNDKKQFKEVHGIGLNALANLFDVDGDPQRNYVVFLELGIKIFGEDNRIFYEALQEYKREQKLKERTPEWWRVYLQERFTPEHWIRMTPTEKEEFIKNHGIGLIGLATIFDIQGNPAAYKGILYKLGLKIFGEDNEMLQRALKEYEKEQELKERTPEWWRMYIREKFTPEQWAHMSLTERENFTKNHGIGLGSLATKFGIKTAQGINNKVLYELGLRIFGENNEILQEALENIEKEIEVKNLTSDQWRSYFKSIFTVKDWINMDETVMSNFFKTHGIGLYALGRKFGIKGNGNTKVNNVFFCELGLKIFGEDNELLQEALKNSRRERDARNQTAEWWKSYVLENFTPSQWVEMKTNDKFKFKTVHEIGLNALARKFGVVGNPATNSEVMYELGRKIFGPEAITTALLQNK